MQCCGYCSRGLFGHYAGWIMSINWENFSVRAGTITVSALTAQMILPANPRRMFISFYNTVNLSAINANFGRRTLEPPIPNPPVPIDFYTAIQSNGPTYLDYHYNQYGPIIQKEIWTFPTVSGNYTIMYTEISADCPGYTSNEWGPGACPVEYRTFYQFSLAAGRSVQFLGNDIHRILWRPLRVFSTNFYASNVPSVSASAFIIASAAFGLDYYNRGNFGPICTDSMYWTQQSGGANQVQGFLEVRQRV